MAYDEDLADRIRHALGRRTKFGEIAMFGGLCFTVKGNMCVGVVRDDLIVRLAAADHDDAMSRPGARPMDFTKRPMKGFLFVGPEGHRSAKMLDAWIARSFAYVSTLPPKAKGAKKAAARKARG